MTISQFEGFDVEYYINLNKNSQIVGLTIRHYEIRQAKWYSWWKRRAPSTKMIRLHCSHDEFEGLAKDLKIEIE